MKKKKSPGCFYVWLRRMPLVAIGLLGLTSTHILAYMEVVPTFQGASRFHKMLSTQKMAGGDASLTKRQDNLAKLGINSFFREAAAWHSGDNAYRNDLDLSLDVEPNSTIGVVVGSNTQVSLGELTSTYCSGWVAESIRRIKDDLFNTTTRKNALTFIELINEPDMASDFVAEDLANCMEETYDAIRNDSWFDGLSVVSPSITFVHSHAKTRSLEHTVEYGNVHAYYSGTSATSRPGQTVRRIVTAARAYNYGTHPIFLTETGRRTDVSNETAAAKKIMTALTTAYAEDVARAFVFTTYDWTIKKWGIFAKNGDDKLLADAIERLTDIVGDDSCTGSKCSRVLPDFAITGAGSDVISASFYHKSDDKYYVALVRDLESEASTESSADTVTVDYGIPLSSCTITNIIDGSTSSPSISGSTVNVDVTDWLQVLGCGLKGSNATPTKPGTISALVSGNLVSLNWGTSSTADAYTVYRAKYDGGKADFVGYVPVATVTDTSYVDHAPALPGMKYRYLVRAKNWDKGSAARFKTVTLPAGLQIREEMMDDDSGVSAKSRGWTFGDPGSDAYDKDRGIARRTSNGMKWLEFTQPNVRAVDVVFFMQSGHSAEKVRLEYHNGSGWVSLIDETFEISDAMSGTHGNQRAKVTHRESLPAGTSRIRIEVFGTLRSKEGIGRVRLYHE